MGRQGFTLIEVLIAGLVTVIAIGAIWTLSQASYAVWSRTEATLTNLSAAQQAINHLREDLHRACAGPGAVTYADGKLTFKLCEAGTPTITYALSGNLLTRKVDTSAAETVAAGLVEFTPQCQDNVVEVVVRTQEPSYGSQSEQRLSSKIWIPNES